jgi:cytochrome c
LLTDWRKANPDAAWESTEAAPAATQRAPAAAKPAARAKQFEVNNNFSARDELVWKIELDKFVKEGHRVFHDAEAFGGTVGVSCDMCHPDASNTHPETYPKYQVQLQRVALLRDMINWCIQHLAKGRPLPDDDPRLRAMEVYILAQRAGKAITPGKH